MLSPINDKGEIMVRKIVLALAIVALTATASTAFACGKGQMPLRVDDGSVIGGTVCADFGGSFWGIVWAFWF